MNEKASDEISLKELLEEKKKWVWLFAFPVEREVLLWLESSDPSSD
jgi:hypothetical protein